MRKKLPSDPNEFELLLYAEKLAREEGIPGFEDSSDGESEPEQSVSTTTKMTNGGSTHINMFNRRHVANNGDINQKSITSEMDQVTEQFISQDNTISAQLLEKQRKDVLSSAAAIGDTNIDQDLVPIGETVSFKWSIGVKVFNSWFQAKVAASPASRLPADMLKLTNNELNIFLAEFVHGVSFSCLFSI